MNPANWQARAEAAERTAAVLKRKVLELYGTEEAASGLHRQLEQTRAREQRQRERRLQSAVRQEELQRHNQRLEREIAQRTATLKTILDHVSSGLLLIDRGLVIRDGCSASCAALFGRPVVGGTPLCRLLGIEGHHAERFLQLAVDQIFEDLLPEETALAQFARHHQVGGRTLELAPSVIREEAGAVSELLITVSDVSAWVEAHRQARHHETLVRVLVQKVAFRQFVEDSRAALTHALDDDDPAVRARAIHTVKGNAASFGLDDLVTTAHRVEARGMADRSAVEEVIDAFSAWLAGNFGVLGIGWSDHERAWQVHARQIAALREAARQGPDRVDGWVEELVRCRAGELLGPVRTFVGRMAERLEKEVVFEVEGEDVLVDPERLGPVAGALPHALRNALDHGIEEAWARGDKPPQGHLKIVVAEDAETWTVSVADDGRGVDTARLCERAVAMGLETRDVLEGWTEEQRQQLVFRDGLSAKEVATDISGRGVGMSALRAVVEAQGGRLSMRSRRGVGTEVRAVVPKTARKRGPAVI